MLNCTAYIHAYVGQYHVFIVTNLTLPEGGDGSSGGEGPGGRPGGRGSSPGSRGGATFGEFLCRSSRYNKVQFYRRSAGRERALFLPISDKDFFKCLSIKFSSVGVLDGNAGLLR